ncbi:cysteine synthase A [Culicoidibacter larvae]|uniref:Cysteine synthase n=1 Tax=Culicoidibacter larvae TaxID=2579976 RepID=A0A5R8QH57_9FIRM|nr:cysteine synthase A [Culicoidibacter larvae]TLG76793.1 cysteine synthase A [Culicoidibacter larvae]
MVYKSIIDMIGNTPILKLQTADDMATVYVKLEGHNPSGSVKDRAAIGMIEAAEASGALVPESVIVEPTSGNTGIALAMIGRMKGYHVIIVMPDTMSVERRKIMQSLGAELILTDGAGGMKAAIAKANELVAAHDNYFMPSQFDNPANPDYHYKSTGPEIISDVPDLDAFVAGVGTGGTITGVGRKLKEHNSAVQVIAVEPSTSAVLEGDAPGKHRIQGIGAGFIPGNYDADVIDQVIAVSDEEAFAAARQANKEFGLFLGISSGANIAVAMQVARTLGPGKKVVTVAPDGGEKYLSTDLYKDE